MRRFLSGSGPHCMRRIAKVGLEPTRFRIRF
jgi:hypothetical protein